MSENKEWLFRIQDMLDCIEKIHSYIEGERYDSFRTNSMIIDAVSRNIEIIGEAAGNIPDHVCEDNPSVPWREIRGMRNKLAHEYSGVNMEVVWKVAAEELADLERVLLKLLEKYGKD